MSTDVSFDVDVNDVFKAVFGAVDSRNDLLAIIQNGTPLTLDITWNVVNGNFQSIVGPTSLPGPTDTPPTATVTALGVDAAGAGSDINLIITSGQDRWQIIVVCPPNQENYFQYLFSDGSLPSSVGGVLQSVVPGPPNYANNGQVTFSGTSSAPNTEVSVSLTNTSPATCQIQFIATS